MESISQNSTATRQITIPLFPSYFKAIGFALILVTFLSFLFLKFTNVQLEAAQRATFKLIAMNNLVLGMLFIAWARNKVENEQSMLIRLKAIAFAFILSLFALVAKPVADIILGSNIKDMTGQDLAFMLFAFYFLGYLLQKKSVNYAA